MDFDLRQLEIFCAVVEQGSFTRAAAEVHLSQSAVSERIAGLEQVVGARLLDRLGRRVEPTEVGRVLHRRAVAMLEAREGLRFELNELLGARRGTLVLAASTIPGGYILPGILARFRQELPEVRVRLLGGDSAAVAGLVLAGKAEAGFVGAPTQGVGLESRPLWDDELVLAVPAGHPWCRRRRVSLDELAGEPFILRGEGSGSRATLESFLASHGAGRLKVAAELGSTGAIKEGLLRGLGVSILSRRALRSELDAGLLHALSLREGRILRSFHLVWHPSRTRSPLCARFLDAVSSS